MIVMESNKIFIPLSFMQMHRNNKKGKGGIFVQLIGIVQNLFWIMCKQVLATHLKRKKANIKILTQKNYIQNMLGFTSLSTAKYISLLYNIL